MYSEVFQPCTLSMNSNEDKKKDTLPLFSRKRVRISPMYCPTALNTHTHRQKHAVLKTTVTLSPCTVYSAHDVYRGIHKKRPVVKTCFYALSRLRNPKLVRHGIPGYGIILTQDQLRKRKKVIFKETIPISAHVDGVRGFQALLSLPI